MKEEESIGSDASGDEAFRVAYLVAGFIRHTLTEAENRELDDWVTANMENQRLFERLIDEAHIDNWVKKKNDAGTTAALEKVKTSMSFKPVVSKPSMRSLWPYAAAAVVAALLIVYLLIPFTPTSKPAPVVQSPPGDLSPGSSRAMLTLSDGTTLLLDTVKNGRIADHDNTIITKQHGGELAYQSVHPMPSLQTALQNVLSTPAGGQYTVVLPDGTRVLLNALSSLQYPTAFAGARRTVTLTGEAYFEVAKDAMFPFEVKVNGSVVQVLGTHFNINAYADEPILKVVLEEGVVRLNNSVTLKPGEQAAVSKNGNIEKSKADLEAALAWKNGQFIFREATIDEVMRQVARWYNAKIVYDADIKDHFTASIARNEPLSKLLHLLEATKTVYFQVDGHQLNVMK